jgi:cell division protein FtsW
MKAYLRELFAKSEETGAMDALLAAAVILLMGFGVVMVYSAGVIEATSDFKDPHHFLKRQGIFAVASLVVMWAVSRFDYHKLRLLTYGTLGGVTVLMLLSVLGFGHTGGGAARWLKVGPIHIQPSEMAKVALVLWLAYSLNKKGENVRSFLIGFLPHLLMAGLLVLICMKQPDFGSATVLLLLTMFMLFVAGVHLRYLLASMVAGSVFATIAIRFTEYRWERIVAWINMAEHRQDLAYQPFQAVMSFGSGELFGLGLGRGMQMLYLPEAHTDFISAIIGEELGFFGLLGLVGVYTFIVVRGVRVALQAEDEYGSYVAFGLSMLFGLQALMNLAISMAMAPTKGLTLPFISYGGSSLLVNAAAMGVLLNVSRPRAKEAVTADYGPAPEATELIALAAGRDEEDEE